MLELAEDSLIGRQIKQFTKIGITDISIVRGFMGHKINFSKVTYFENKDFDNSNMLVSLFTASSKMKDDIIVSYGDIMFSQLLLEKILCEKGDVLVSVDVDWEKYWLMRYETTSYDTESLKLGRNNFILSLGEPDPNVNDIDGRYVGLLRFSETGLNSIKNIWNNFKNDYWDKPWQISGNPLREAYLTDMLQAMIDENQKVKASITHNGWIEFDTDNDYENAKSWIRSGKMKNVLRMDI